MSLRKQATSGLVWTFAQQFGNRIISFSLSIVLARLLMPEDFGLIGMIAVFVAVAKTLMDSGLTQSLIRSKEVDQEDYSTVFYFNLLASIIIYIIIYFAAPFIADFYDKQILVEIVRLYCVVFIIAAFSSVQRTRLTKIMNFKTQMIIDIPSNLIAGIIGITMAYLGYGVYSLIWSNIASYFLGAVLFWFHSNWRPSFVFNVSKFIDHFNFGYKLTLSALLNQIYDNIYLIVIGKYFSVVQVGFYTRALSTQQMPVSNLSSALNKVTYPLFAGIQDDDIRLKRIYSELMQMVIFIIAPIMIFLAILAEPMFRFMFTEKWLPAVPYFQILCIIGILYPLNSYNLNVLKVKGRSDLFLKLEIYKKIIITISIIISIRFGIYGLLWSQVILSVFSYFINSYYTGRFIGYSALDQLRDILPIFAISLIAGAAVFSLDNFLLSEEIDIVRVSAGILIGGICYLGLSWILKFQSLHQIKKIISRK